MVFCNHFAFGSIDYDFAGLLVKIDLGSVRTDRTRTTVRVEEELTFREVVVRAAAVVLDCRETYLAGKLVVSAVGKGVLDTTLAYSLPFDIESALQSLDALLAY